MVINRIYADNAATTSLDPDALDTMMRLLQDYANPSQPYSFSRTVKSELKKARATIAECINALPEEIYFTSGGSESDNWAIKKTIFNKTQGSRIITTAFEHHAVLNACKSVQEAGCEVDYLYPTSDGKIQSECLIELLRQPAHLVSVMYANNEIGSIQPIKELAKIAHDHGALFHTDAVQAIGHVPIDVRDLDVDLLSASAHKFNGPKGIGFLFVKKGTKIRPLIDGGAQEFGMRAGTENVPAICAMAVALKKNSDHLKTNSDVVRSLETHLLNQLVQGGVAFHKNGSENHLPGLISLSFKGELGESILHRLDLKGISVSTGSACDSKSIQISHVLKAIGLPEDLAKGTIRISLGKGNTISDVDSIVNCLCSILPKID